MSSVHWVRQEAGSPWGGQFAGAVWMGGPPAVNQVTVILGTDGVIVEDDPDVEDRECRVCLGVFGFRWDRWEPDVCDPCLTVITP